MSTLLQQFTFNGTLIATGSLALAPFDVGSTLGTPTYVAGPTTGTQAISVTTSQHFTLPFSSTLNFNFSSPFSLGLWVYQSSPSSQAHVLANNTVASQAGIEYEIYGGTTLDLGVWSRNNSRPYDVNSSTNTTLSSWHHFWATYDGATLIVFIDGVAIGSININTTITSVTPWQINKGRVSGVTGALADVRWYSGVVSPQTAMTPVVTGPVISTVQFTSTPTSITATHPAVTNALYYTIKYSVGSSAVYTTYLAQTPLLTVLISGLLPATLYSFKIYSLVGTTLSLTATGSTTTPANTAINYTKAALASDTIPNTYTIGPLSTASATSTRTVEAAVNSIFSTGDKILSTANVGLSAQPVIASVLDLGTVIPVVKNRPIYVPFSTVVSTSQQASLQLTDNSIVPITYSNTADTITVNGVTYSPGDRFILDGQVVTVCEI